MIRTSAGPGKPYSGRLDNSNVSLAGHGRGHFSGDFVTEGEHPLDTVRLREYLAMQEMRLDDTPLRQFSGGLANRNYLISVDGAPAVLRRPPSGDLPPGAHDMEREFRILSALSPLLDFVPRPLHFCSDRSVIGVPFQLMEYRPGAVIRGEAVPPFLSGREGQLCELIVRSMARIHAVDAAEAGLERLGRPEGFLARNVGNWTDRGRRVAQSPAITKLVEEIGSHLSRRRFLDRPPSILHCDLKFDNMLLEPQDLSLVAIVDWDMGTRGNPLFDLATMLSYWAQADDPEALRQLGQMPTTQPGFWSRAETAARYGELTGVRLDDLPDLCVLAMFKLGIVFMQLHRQFLEGAVADPRYAAFRARGEGLLDFAWHIRKGGFV